MTIITCTKNTELPKTPLYCYVSPTIEQATAMHTKHDRPLPERVYQLKREWYFPVTDDTKKGEVRK